MNHKEAFIQYAEDRGYVVTDVIQNNNSIVATVTSEDQSPINLKHFTQVLNVSKFAKFTGTVRLSFKDFFNEEVTEGMICDDHPNHDDRRVCQMIGCEYGDH